MLPAQVNGGPEALVGEGRRHADVDDGHVGPVPFDRAAQRFWVTDGAGDDKAPIHQELDQAVAEHSRVFRDDDAVAGWSPGHPLCCSPRRATGDRR